MNGSYCVRNLEELRRLSPNSAAMLRLDSFQEFNDAVENISSILFEFNKGSGRYRGMGPFYQLWTDSEAVKSRKDSLFDAATHLHSVLSASSDFPVPFRFITEPFGGSGPFGPDKTFGQWDWSERFFRNAVSVFSERGIEVISISQNRIRDDGVAEKTLELCQRFQGAGIECAIAWQVWVGWGQFETISKYLRRSREAHAVGVPCYLGEVGFRYSQAVRPGEQQLRLALLEQEYCVRHRCRGLFDQLESLEDEWTFWNARKTDPVGAGRMMHIPRLDPLDGNLVPRNND